MGGFGIELKSYNICPPVNLAYTAAMLRQYSYQVNILDAVALNYSTERTLNHIQENKFDAIGVNTATPSIKDDLLIIDLIKDSNHNTVIFALGPHVSIFPEETLKNSKADFVVRYEPEYTVLESLQRLEKGKDLVDVKGVTYKIGERIISNQNRPWIKDLDKLPFPARDLLPMDKYQTSVWTEKPFTTILASRGCPYKCTYCPYIVSQGREWRARSAENIVEEIREVIEKFGVREILFRDPVFTFDKKRAIKIAELLIQEGLNVNWRCETRVDLLDQEILKIFGKAGCRGINFGIESGSISILRAVKRKPIPEEKIVEIFGICNENKIETMAFFIIGLPGENKNTIKETIRLAKKIDPDFSLFTAATPYPKTEYYEYLKSQRLLKNDWTLFTSRIPTVGTEELTPEEFKKAIKHAYTHFYFRPRYILKRLKKMRNHRELLRVWNGLKTILRYSGLLKSSPVE
jgi:radical SAM superfamily enzyme YgiQ (UPF0313 family)